MRQHSNQQLINRFMTALGRSVSSPGKVYFTGGVSAVLLGWREMTMDIDLKAEPEPIGFFESLPRLKTELDINIELASPDQFVPPLRGWKERCQFIAHHGQVQFYHFDFYCQALAKIERGHARDRHDVGKMMETGLVIGSRLVELTCEAEPMMVRYPAVEAATLMRRVTTLAEKGEWV